MVYAVHEFENAADDLVHYQEYANNIMLYRKAPKKLPLWILNNSNGWDVAEKACTHTYILSSAFCTLYEYTPLHQLLTTSLCLSFFKFSMEFQCSSPKKSSLNFLQGPCLCLTFTSRVRFTNRRRKYAGSSSSESRVMLIWTHAGKEPKNIHHYMTP